MSPPSLLGARIVNPRWVLDRLSQLLRSRAHEIIAARASGACTPTLEGTLIGIADDIKQALREAGAS